MFRRPRFRVVLVWLVLAGLRAFCQAGAEPAARGNELRYHATRWTVEDGLPQMRISALAQTPDGYLWVGTWFGLARFDGLRFVVFNSENTPELPNEAITALAVDRDDGALWIGTPGGLVRFQDRQFHRLAGAHELATSTVHALVAARGGGVWIWTHAATGFWRGGKPVAAPLVLGGDTHRHAIWETHDGRLVMCTASQGFEWSRGGQLREWAPPGAALGGQWLSGLCFADEGRTVWLGTQGGLHRFAEGQWRQLQSFGPRLEPHDLFLADQEGAVWAACAQAGLFRCEAAGAESVSLGVSSAEKSVNCLFQDQEQNVWVGTDGGLFRLRRPILHAYGVADGLPRDECRSICEGPDGAIWVETPNGAARMQGGSIQTFPDAPKRPARFSVLVSGDQSVWLGNGHNGLDRWRPGGETEHVWHGASETQASGVTLDSLYLDREGMVWAGTDHGVTWFENGQPATGWGEAGLPTNSVRSIHQTRDGTMWFGTWQGGAVRWKRRGAFDPQRSRDTGLKGVEVARYTTADGLADDRVFVFHEDAGGALWVGTHNGLSRFKAGRWFTYRAEQGLYDNLINWLEEDDAGRLWFSCNRGIFRMNRAELDAVAEGRQRRATAIAYGVADGMLTPETNGEHQPAGCKARDGRIWFPTAEGVVVLDPHALHAAESPRPLVVIEQVRANERIVFGDGATNGMEGAQTPMRPLRLPPGGAHVLQIHYTANLLSAPERVRLQYRLAGHDRDWHGDDQNRRVAYYTNLRPGDYTFQVMASDPNGVWNPDSAQLRFRVAPYFYETWTFYSLCGLGCVVSGLALHWRRVRGMQAMQRLQQQRALQEERARIARDLHDDLGASLTGLALKLEAAERRGRTEPEHLGRLAGDARQLAHAMRELSWATNPRCDNVNSLCAFLAELTERFCAEAGLECSLELGPTDNPRPVPAQLRHDLLVLVKEVLANSLKHGRARTIRLEIGWTADRLRLAIGDDGKGFDPCGNFAGSGLRNLGERMEKAGGDFVVNSSVQHGTTILATVPLPEAERIAK